LQKDTQIVSICNLNMSNKTTISYGYIEKFLSDIRSRGRYAFTLEELMEEFNLPYLTIKQGLYRLKLKKVIFQVRQGFYTIVPPEYSVQGVIPIYFYLDDLMKFLGRTYYLSLLSAAALHGAAHQQPMEFFVTIQHPALRSIKNKKVKINFVLKNNWPEEAIVQHKTNSGYINVSSPEWTALDLMAYADKFGLNRVVTVIQELAAEIKVSNLFRAAIKYDNISNLQRLGYILDNFIDEENKLADSLHKVLEKKKYNLILLSPVKGKKGEIDKKWRVRKNMEIESDL